MSTVTTFTNFNRHVNLNKVIDYLVENDVTLDEFTIKGDCISIQVSFLNDFDAGLFDEFLEELEMAYDEEHFGV